MRIDCIIIFYYVFYIYIFYIAIALHIYRRSPQNTVRGRLMYYWTSIRSGKRPQDTSWRELMDYQTLWLNRKARKSLINGITTSGTPWYARHEGWQIIWTVGPPRLIQGCNYGFFLKFGSFILVDVKVYWYAIGWSKRPMA